MSRINVSSHRYIYIYIYILTVILCLLGIGRINAYATITGSTMIYGNGGYWPSSGATSISGNPIYGGARERDHTTWITTERPVRDDGAVFYGYIARKYTGSGYSASYGPWYQYEQLVPAYMSRADFEDLVYSYKNNIDKNYTIHTTVYGLNFSCTYNTRTKKQTFDGVTFHNGSYINIPQLFKVTPGDMMEMLFERHYDLCQPGDTFVGYKAYALWGRRKGFSIKFDVNGGSISISNQIVNDIILPNPGTRPGYTFDGWYNGNTKIGGIGDKWKPTADATITAHWTPITYTIRYVLYGGEVSGNPETYTIETPTFTLNNPIQDNQTFTGWTDAGKVGTKASNISESTEPKTSFQIVKGQYGDRVFTANWKSSSWKDASDADNNDDADKVLQKRDTTESKVKRNRIRIG